MAVAISLATLIPTAITGLAGNQISATINVVPPAVKSVTVSISSATYDSCVDGSSTATQLGFPNGRCATPSYTVANGNTAAQIDVTGADAAPSSGGTPWTLCGLPAGSACTGTNGHPGQDQYGDFVYNTVTISSETVLAKTPQCDIAFSNPCGISPANTSTGETSGVEGPSASSNSSSTFTTTVTYTAV